MDLRWLIFFLASVGCVSAAGNCGYKALFEHLGLDNSDSQMTSLRPVHNWTTPTFVYMNLLVTSITEVDEKAQSISTQVTVYVGWFSEFTIWKPDDFCGINQTSIKKDLIWTPEFNIVESIKTEFATADNQYVQLRSDGIIVSATTLSLTVACKMNVHNFPFDVQSCNFTIQSPILIRKELLIFPFSDASFLTLSSKAAFQTQGEWELLSINISKGIASTLGEDQDQLIYTITMRRRPLLYIINFLMPVLYFLVLDLASFFIDSNAGEKLSFKVTLLLAISVLLLLLKDMLPSTSSDVPLIGIYCVVIFTLMAINVLVTIFVNFLLAKGNEIVSVAPVESTSALSDTVRDPSDPVADMNEERPSTLSGLKQILMKFQAATHQNHKRKALYWIRAAKIVDVIFFLMYITTVIVFLMYLSNAWFP